MMLSKTILRIFFAQLLLSGCHNASVEDLFWNSYGDFCIRIVATVMPRGGFRKLNKCFHTINLSNFEPDEKMPHFMKSTIYFFQQFGRFHTKLGTNESKIP